MSPSAASTRPWGSARTPTLTLWLVGETPDALQEMLAAFRRTKAGASLELAWSFMGVTKPAEFSKDHSLAFVRGEDPKKYLCVHPFVRTPEWYLLPAEKRAAMPREHGEIGRESQTCWRTRPARSASTSTFSWWRRRRLSMSFVCLSEPGETRPRTRRRIR